MSDDQVKILQIHRHQEPLYGTARPVSLLKALLDPLVATKQDSSTGERPHPIDFAAAIDLMSQNTHHETCIGTKRDALVGLGFMDEEDKELQDQKKQNIKDSLKPQPVLPAKPKPTAKAEEEGNADKASKAYEALAPLCDGPPQELMNITAEDYCHTGNAYWEVVRNGEKVVSIWNIPVPSVYVFIEDRNILNRHFVVRTEEGKERKFARFGDKKQFLARPAGANLDPNDVSEVIHFKRGTSRSRHYGLPIWLSAVPAIELSQMVHQQQFDFFKNRGVPEFMAFFLGQQLPADIWKKVEDAMRAQIGVGNTHKSLAMNITDPNMRVEIHKLGLEGKTENSFQELNDVLAMEIVTAHRVPPLLAGIQIPGKLGAVNELPNALLAFQALLVDQDQTLFTETMLATIGPELSLDRSDLTFRKITDKFDLQKLDTQARMREPVAEGRDPAEGLKKEDLTPEAIGKALGRLLVAINKAA